ncbi:MAG TPA: thioesterase family protein [Nitrospinota bacterium]|jgi:acyl-CoA thioester hydrolase|nr:thioesterase family protein [Nitrospinota bacterium]HJP14369.1 thioesterase family protein [Nitrospinota bacterium]
MPLAVRFRVRYTETDQMGVVHHAVYFVWFEHLRTEYFRELGTPYGELEAGGVFFPVVESGCRYLDGARYDGEVEISGWLREPRGARVRIDYRAAQEGRVCAEGFTVHARTDASGRPGRIPPELFEKMKAAASPPGEGPGEAGS